MSSVDKCIILPRINSILFVQLYNVIAVYIFTVLYIETSAKFESQFNLLAVSCYLDHIFSASFKMQLLAFEAVC